MLRKLLSEIFRGRQRKHSRPTLTSGISMGQFVQRAIRQMPPPPAPRYSEEELRKIVSETEEPAIGLARIYPPDPTQLSTSFMGGLPRLPEDVAWPTSPISNRPCTFLAQIDCAALPQSQHRPWLPESGTLWIFIYPDIDTYFCERVIDSEGSHVIYRDVDASTLTERQPPDGPPWWEGEWGETDFYPCFGAKKLDELRGSFPTVFTPWALEFALLKSYRDDWNNEVSINDDNETEKPDLSEPSDLPRLKRVMFTRGEWESLRRNHASLLRQAWLDAFGLNKTGYIAWDRSNPWEKRASTPLTWLTLRAFCITVRHKLKQQLDHAETTSDMAATIRQAIDTLSFWLTEADNHPVLGVMSAERRDTFLKTLQSIKNPDNKVRDLEQSSLGRRLKNAVHDVLGYQIWHPDCGPAGFDPSVIECESFHHRPFTRVHQRPFTRLHDRKHDKFRYHTSFHRLLGAQTTEYYGGPGPEGHILLAEFNYDRGIDLKIGDMSSLVFWIRPEDLAAREFSKVLVTPGTGTVDFNQERFNVDGDKL